MKQKKMTWATRLFIVIMAGIVLFAMTVLSVNLMHTSRAEKYKKENELFTTAAKILVPNGAYAALGIPETKRSFGEDTQQPYYIKQNIGYQNSDDAMMIKGTLKKQSGAWKALPAPLFSNRICVVKQSLFLNASQKQSDQKWRELSAESGTWHQLWFGFKKSLNSLDYFNQYAWLLESQDASGGIVSSVFKTSDSPDAVALSYPGNYTWYNSPPDYTASSMYVQFKNDLKQLGEQQKQVQKYLDSGIFGKELNVNFENRSKYVESRLCDVLGFVACVKEEKLKKLRQDDLLYLIDFDPS